MTIRLMLAAAAVLAAAVPATAADVGLVPPAVAIHNECANTSVLDRIIDRFAWAERNTWRRGFIIEALHNPRPSGHPYAAPGIIERSYCMADSVMTDGQFRTVYYAIEYGVGFASIGDYVDFCVLGLDPWHVHDGSCRTVR